MATRVRPADRSTSTGQNADMERSIAVSADVTGSVGLYSSVVTTAPGGKTRIHHHGECETSIYIVSGVARYTWGPTGLESTMDAGAGDFIYIPAGEIHVEENASSTEPLVVVPDTELPGLGRALHGRRAGRIGRHPGSVLTPPWREIPFESLLAEHGLGGLPEHDFPTDGWSGARFSMIERGRRPVRHQADVDDARLDRGGNGRRDHPRGMARGDVAGARV